MTSCHCTLTTDRYTARASIMSGRPTGCFRPLLGLRLSCEHLFAAGVACLHEFTTQKILWPRMWATTSMDTAILYALSNVWYSCGLSDYRGPWLKTHHMYLSSTEINLFRRPELCWPLITDCLQDKLLSSVLKETELDRLPIFSNLLILHFARFWWSCSENWAHPRLHTSKQITLQRTRVSSVPDRRL
jgi:hypothetical protein